jgi:general secretion pathway protein N
MEMPGVDNPPAAIPRGALSETLARPELSPSRRPPLPAGLVALPAAPAKPGSQPKSEPDHPLLTLLGTIVGRSMEIGVFIDDASQDVIRLKTGQVHGGWTLRSVSGRAANFERGDHREATLALQERGAEPTPPSPVAANPASEHVGIRNNVGITGPPPVNTMSPGAVPAAAKQRFKRTPRES